MSNQLQLRGHHLLCLLGFRGMGYSPEFTRNMSAVYERLRRKPDTVVSMTSGPDELCACFSADKPNHCRSDSVHERDEAVLRLLRLSPGERTTWRDVLSRIRSRMTPSDIPRLCATCPWQPYGVCEAGVARVVSGQALAPLPDPPTDTLFIN